MSAGRRVVHLRAESQGADRRYLDARLDDIGNLRIEGHDLGPLARGGEEYEWVHTITAADLPCVIELLDGQAGDDVLDLLEARWTGVSSYELERRLRESSIEVSTWTWW